MADYIATTEELTAVADAIRAKGGATGTMVFPEGFVSAIGNIQTGDSDHVPSVGNVVYSTGSSAEVSFDTKLPERKLVCIFLIHRQTEVLIDGWNLLYNSAGHQSFEQHIEVLYKLTDDNSVNVTVNNDVWPFIIASFSTVKTPTIEMASQETNASQVTVCKNQVGLVVWLRHEVYWWPDSTGKYIFEFPCNSETITQDSPLYKFNFPILFSVENDGYGRLMALFDYTPNVDISLSISRILEQYYGEFMGIRIN